MCILALCRVCVCVCVCVRVCARPHVTRTSAVNLRRYGNTPQTITIHDLVEISLLCAAHATSLVLFIISTTWFNDIDNNHSILSCYP